MVVVMSHQGALALVDDLIGSDAVERLTKGSRGASGCRLQERANFLQCSLIPAAWSAWATSASATPRSSRRPTGLPDDINRLLPIPIKKVGVRPKIEQMLDQVLVSAPRRLMERRSALLTIDAVILIAVP